jgi:hypothetical protein
VISSAYYDNNEPAYLVSVAEEKKGQKEGDKVMTHSLQ